MKRYNVRPSKAISLMGFCVGLAMSVIGFVFLIGMIASGVWPVALFLLVWIAGAVSITVLHGKNAFGKKGVPIEHIEFEDTEAVSFDDELRKLKKLLDDGIISQSDFDKKKQEILNKV